jgi:UDP-N-acetylglucosamine 3-dehydrogenase
VARRYRVAVIGCGRPHRSEGATGFGMSHAHVHGYQETGQCDLVAVADVSRENAEAFAERWAKAGADPGVDRSTSAPLPGGPAIYLDYREMLAREKPEIVSVCTWPHLHAEMVIACAEAGVRAVHCEKPMAPTWGEARRMAAACEKKGTQLTFNHQRRFLEPFRVAREQVRQGAIGALRRIEGACGDMIDWGTHWLDMFFFYNEETPAEWVLGQIDARRVRKIFGLPVEEQGLCQVKFKNGVRGLLFTGHEADIGCANRLIGTEGVIEVHNEAPHLRARGTGDAALRPVETKEGIHGSGAIDRAIADLVAALDAGREPELSARRALQATEVIFATYESSRRRGRIDLPLTIDDSPLLTMLEQGEIGGEAS